MPIIILHRNNNKIRTYFTQIIKIDIGKLKRSYFSSWIKFGRYWMYENLVNILWVTIYYGNQKTFLSETW